MDRQPLFQRFPLRMLRIMNKPGVILWLLFCSVMLASESDACAQVEDRRYELQARMLYPLASMVRSSQEATNGSRTYVIGVLGTDPFDDGAGRNHLDNMVASKQKLAGSRVKVPDKNLVVKRFAKPDEIDQCDLLYISDIGADPKSLLLAVRSSLRNSPVLIVCNAPGFAQQGAVLNLFLRPPNASGVQTLGIEYNPDAARHHGFDQIDPTALRLFAVKRQQVPLIPPN
jgi:hypothetical protein